MKSLLNKDSIKNIKFLNNKFRITKKDLVGQLKGFPLGIVVRMLEETEMQGNEPDVRVFQNNICFARIRGGFDWNKTVDGHVFWAYIIEDKNYDKFYNKYPEYKKYDI